MTDTRFSAPPALDPETGGLRLELVDAEAVRSFFTDAKKESGFLLPLAGSPKLFEVLTVRALCGESFEMELSARVIQSFERPGPDGARFQVAFQLEGWNPGRDAELTRKLAQVPSRGAAQGGGDGGTAGAGVTEGEVTGASPLFRIKALNPNERMRLATKAGRTERAILVRDTSSQVLTGLLSNPRLDGEDVLHLVRSTHANAALLKRVAEDRRWSQNPEIRAALVRNPKTPTPIALRLLETLRTPDLQVLAKSGQSKEALRRAAVRLYLKRIQRK